MILDEHDKALLELHSSSNAFDDAIASMRQTLADIQQANHAQGRANDRVIAANRIARELFNDDNSTH